MDATIKELQTMGALKGFTLIAGEKGLSNSVNSCCLLDFEFDPELKNKYVFSNFKPGQLVFTSFLYAKDKPYLLPEAIRRLIRYEAAGLVIRNVYRLPIPEAVLRTADTNGFPIFLLEDTDQFLDPIFAGIHRAIHTLYDINEQEKILCTLLNTDLTEMKKADIAFTLLPKIRGPFITCYFSFDKESSSERLISLFMKSRSIIQGNTDAAVFVYRQGILAIGNVEFPDIRLANVQEYRLKTELESEPGFVCAGVSDVHHSPAELGDAIEESIMTSFVAQKGQTQLFDSIGTYKILIDAAGNKRMQKFSKNIIDMITDYDAGGSAELLHTLHALIECNGSLPALSKKLGLHENTLRQRLGKIKHLTGLDFRSPNEYDQLSLAVKIKQVSESPWQVR